MAALTPVIGPRPSWSFAILDPRERGDRGVKVAPHGVSRQASDDVRGRASVKPAGLQDWLTWPARPVGHEDVPIAEDHLGACRAVDDPRAERAGGVVTAVRDADAAAERIRS